MQLRKVRKGDKVSMPLISINGKGGGVCRIEAQENGILVRTTPEESNANLLFLSENELKKIGYFALRFEKEETEKTPGNNEEE